MTTSAGAGWIGGPQQFKESAGSGVGESCHWCELLVLQRRPQVDQEDKIIPQELEIISPLQWSCQEEPASLWCDSSISTLLKLRLGNGWPTTSQPPTALTTTSILNSDVEDFDDASVVTSLNGFLIEDFFLAVVDDDFILRIFEEHPR